MFILQVVDYAVVGVELVVAAQVRAGKDEGGRMIWMDVCGWWISCVYIAGYCEMSWKLVVDCAGGDLMEYQLMLYAGAGKGGWNMNGCDLCDLICYIAGCEMSGRLEGGLKLTAQGQLLVVRRRASEEVWRCIVQCLNVMWSHELYVGCELNTSKIWWHQSALVSRQKSPRPDSLKWTKSPYCYEQSVCWARISPFHSLFTLNVPSIYVPLHTPGRVPLTWSEWSGDRCFLWRTTTRGHRNGLEYDYGLEWKVCPHTLLCVVCACYVHKPLAIISQPHILAYLS